MENIFNKHHFNSPSINEKRLHVRIILPKSLTEIVFFLIFAS